MSRITRVAAVFVTIFLFSLLGAASLRAEILAQMPRPPRDDTPLHFPPLPFDTYRQLARPAAPLATAGYGDWSKVVFQSYRDGNWEIYSANGDGTGQTRLTANTASDTYPRLNRGGTRIVFDSNRTGIYEIYTMNPDGSGLSQVTASTNHNYDPAWSPDGSKIAFESFRDGQAEIYVMNANGTALTRLTNHPAFDGHPTWSPDGTKIAFTSDRGTPANTGNRVWVMNADGSSPQQLTTQSYCQNPNWSPDGTRIAFDADATNDSSQELWLMNADGSGQAQVYDPPDESPLGYPGVTDAWVRGWSPDGNFIAFTRLTWIYYQGAWYWYTGYLDAVDTVSFGAFRLVPTQGDDWYPDWQSLDIWAPQSSMNSLPLQSPSPFTVRWTGSDTGLAGLQSYDVQTKDGANGAWTDWQTKTTATRASYSGIGGHTYFFRIRARDNAGNIAAWSSSPYISTTVETLVPNSAVYGLPAFARDHVHVTWHGDDPGGSGILNYDVQYRDGIGGTWVNWQMATVSTSEIFTGSIGHTYFFRTRAQDQAFNQSSWPGDDAASQVTFYAWAVTGTIHDNAGAPVSGAQALTKPSAAGVMASDANGYYASYVITSASTYTTSWSKALYEALPDTGFNVPDNTHWNVTLPPLDNVIKNWGFESGTGGMDDWLMTGIPTPTVTTRSRHTGQYSAMLGQTPKMAQNVSRSPITSTEADMIVDQQGLVHMVWVDATSGGHLLMFAEQDGLGNWSTPLAVSNGSLDLHEPQIEVDHSGAVHVVARSYAPAGIYYVGRQVDRVWSAPVQVAALDPNWLSLSSPPSMAVDVNGQVHVVWHSYYGLVDVFYARRDSPGNWSAPLNISADTPGGSWFPQVQADSTGTIHVVWRDWDGTAQIFYATRNLSGTWSTAVNVSHTPDWSENPQLVVEEPGRVHVAWVDDMSNTGIHDVFYAQLADGHWSTAVNVSNTPTNSEEQQLAVDSNHHVHIVWKEATTGSQVYYAQRTDTGTWTNATPIAGVNGEADSPQIVASQDSIVVAWRGLVSGQYEILCLERPLTGFWTTPDNCSMSPGSSSAPQLQAAKFGQIHLTWSASTSDSAEVYYTTWFANESRGDSQITQVVTLPVSLSNPGLSFQFQYYNAWNSPYSWFHVEVDEGPTAALLFSSTTNTGDEWTPIWIDLSTWAGQTITLTFKVHQVATDSPTTILVDEVALGSTFPDIWIRAESAPLTSHSTPHLLIHYGNQGGAPASNVSITASLPADLVYVDASWPPLTTTPWLTWNLDEIPGYSQPFTLAITAAVNTTATMFSVVTSTVTISTNAAELETANNAASAATFLAYRTFLPITWRN